MNTCVRRAERVRSERPSLPMCPARGMIGALAAAGDGEVVAPAARTAEIELRGQHQQRATAVERQAHDHRHHRRGQRGDQHRARRPQVRGHVAHHQPIGHRQQPAWHGHAGEEDLRLARRTVAPDHCPPASSPAMSHCAGTLPNRYPCRGSQGTFRPDGLEAYRGSPCEPANTSMRPWHHPPLPGWSHRVTGRCLPVARPGQWVPRTSRRPRGSAGPGRRSQCRGCRAKRRTPCRYAERPERMFLRHERRLQPARLPPRADTRTICVS